MAISVVLSSGSTGSSKLVEVLMEKGKEMSNLLKQAKLVVCEGYLELQTGSLRVKLVGCTF